MTQLFRFFFLGFCLLAASAHAADDSPLHEAVKKGDKAEVEALLAKGADVNAKNKFGSTPLHSAASSGEKDIAELLLAKGADVNAKNARGHTPLHYATYTVKVQKGKKDLAALLLAKGADVNAMDEAGLTPLHNMTIQSDLDWNKEVAELLLAKGADVNVRAGKRDDGGTPLHDAVRTADRTGRIEAAKFLLDHGARVDAQSVNAGTPLMLAVSESNDGNNEIVALLLAKGADINIKPTVTGLYPSQNTPLQWARDLGKVALAEQMENHVLKQAKNPREIFGQLSQQLKDKPDDRDRRLIIKLASELKPAPAIPEEARKHFVEGAAIKKAAKNPAQQSLAAQSFTEALKIAPWWGDAYYNLGVTQELAENYDEAEKALTFYLLSNPSETDKREAQDRIYALSAKRKLSGAK